jgi:hypothetical protein
VSAWVATELPTDLTDDEIVVRYENVAYDGPVEGGIDVTLSQPYDIPAEGCYVGYSFTIDQVVYQSDAYPVLSTGTDTPETLFIRTDKTVTTWGDLYGQGFGVLYLQVLLQGDFEDNMVEPSGIGTVYAAVNQPAATTMTLTNLGVTPVTSIDYIVTSNGIDGAEQHLDLSEPLPFNATATVSIQLQGEAQSSIVEQILTITKVNGQENNAENGGTSYLFYTLSEIAARNVAVEEYTGTGCGWCPRGIVGMEKMRNTFGDRFVGIALHQYNTSDPMYLATNSYARLTFQGAPSCTLDRKVYADPYYGTLDDICDDFTAMMAVPALAKVDLRAVWNADKTKVDAEATVTSLIDEKDLFVEFVLVADGVTGTTTAWRQSNYYMQYSSAQLPDDLALFASGGSMGQAYVSGIAFNDVAISSSYQSGTNQVDVLSELAAGQPVQATYTLSLPTSTTLKNAIQTDKVYAIALIIDSDDNTVANAVKVPVTDAVADGVAELTSVMAAPQSYSLDGRRLPAPKKGLTIVRTADGRTQKVLVK